MGKGTSPVVDESGMMLNLSSPQNSHSV